MIEQWAAMPTYEAYQDSGVEWLGEIPAQTVGRNKRSVSGKSLSPETPIGLFWPTNGRMAGKP